VLDPLSDVFQSLRLDGGVFLDARFTEPWCVESHMKVEYCRPFMPTIEQVIGYHVVTEGSMQVAVGDEPPIEVGAGEIVLLPRNDPHILSRGRKLPPIPSVDLMQPSPDGGLMRVRHGGGGAATNMVCGFLGLQGAYNPLLSTLPSLVKIDITKAASRDWIEASMRFAAEELVRGRLPGSSVMAKLSEVLLVEAMREYSSSLGDGQHGWMRGLNDPQIARALAVIHRDIAAPLTAEDLAREAALSRSAFIDKFSTVIGMPPIRYLTLWRLEAAKRHLQESRMSIDQIAYTIGYESEEGFRRAFKREVGSSPAKWRALKLADKTA
jgi:AraC-like DNA-binding protein